MPDSGNRILVLGYGRMGSWLAGFLSDKNSIAVYDPHKKEDLTRLNIKFLNDPSEIREFDSGYDNKFCFAGTYCESI